MKTKKTSAKTPANKTLKTSKKPVKIMKTNKISSTPITIYQEEKSSKLFENSKEILLAAVCILVIFYVALMASMPRKEAITQMNGDLAKSEQRTGSQTVSLTILPSGETQMSQATSGTQQKPVVSSVQTNNAMGMMGMGGPNSTIEAGKQFVFKIDKFQKLATQPLKFNLYDEKGKEITPDYLETQHDYKAHFILVSADLRSYQHLHPEYKNNVWNVSANMTSQGTYYAYVDIKPLKGDAIVLRKALTVRAATDTKTIKYPGLTPKLTAISKDVTAVASPDPSVLNRPTAISFALTRGGKAVNDLKPYLAAFGHVVVLKQGSPEVYMHLHPNNIDDESKAVIPFSATFTSAGRYTAFAEFKIGKDVLTFPITFDVP
jgi:hypothetical protein